MIGKPNSFIVAILFLHVHLAVCGNIRVKKEIDDYWEMGIDENILRNHEENYIDGHEKRYIKTYKENTLKVNVEKDENDDKKIIDDLEETHIHRKKLNANKDTMEVEASETAPLTIDQTSLIGDVKNLGSKAYQEVKVLAESAGSNIMKLIRKAGRWLSQGG